MKDFDAMPYKTGTRLHDLRTKAGLSYEALSAKIAEQYGVRVSRNSLLNYEATDGERLRKSDGMRVEYLRCFADFFNVSTDYLVGLTDDPARKPSAVDELPLNLEAVERLKEYCNRFHDIISLVLLSNNLRSILNNAREIQRMAEEYGLLRGERGYLEEEEILGKVALLLEERLGFPVKFSGYLSAVTAIEHDLRENAEDLADEIVRSGVDTLTPPDPCTLTLSCCEDPNISNSAQNIINEVESLFFKKDDINN